MRVRVEGGDAIVREAPGGYCMLVGPEAHLEVATMGSWIVYTRDEVGGAGLYRVRVDGGPIEKLGSLASMPTGISASAGSIAVHFDVDAIGGGALAVVPPELILVLGPEGV